MADDLPDDVDTPRVAKADADSEVILWANLTGPGFDVLTLTDYADRYLVDRLSSIDGVSQVNLGGGQTYAMRVWPNASALAARGLSVADVQAALRRENVEFPAAASNRRTATSPCVSSACSARPRLSHGCR